MTSQAVEQFLLPVLISELLTDDDLLTSFLLRENSRDADVEVCKSEKGGDFKT